MRDKPEEKQENVEERKKNLRNSRQRLNSTSSTKVKLKNTSPNKIFWISLVTMKRVKVSLAPSEVS